MRMVAAPPFRFTQARTSRSALLRKIAQDIGLTADQLLGREAAQQPAAPEERAPEKKPPARR